MRLTSILCAAILAVICSVCVFAGRIPVLEDDLDRCLADMATDAIIESALEEQLERALEELKAAEAVVETYKWYRDDNRTDALACLKNLTLCNIENEFKTLDAVDVKRSK